MNSTPCHIFLKYILKAVYQTTRCHTQENSKIVKQLNVSYMNGSFNMAAGE